MNLVYDPDGDGLGFNYKNAHEISKRIDMFNIIRRNLVPKDGEFFDFHSEKWINKYKHEKLEGKVTLPEEYDPFRHDR